MAALGAKSAELRRARATVRNGLLNGAISVGDVFADLDRYACVRDMAVIDVLRMASPTRRKGSVWEANIGRRAVLDRVNLLIRVENASQATLAWAAENAPRTVRRGSPELVAA